MRDQLVIGAVVAGFALTCVGFAVEVGAGWALLWAGCLLMVGALVWDARG